MELEKDKEKKEEDSQDSGSSKVSIKRVVFWILIGILVAGVAFGTVRRFLDETLNIENGAYFDVPTIPNL